MPQQNVKTILNNKDKQNTYKHLMGKYRKAVNSECYFEALLIVYAMLEDRFRSMIYHSGGLTNRSAKSFCKKAGVDNIVRGLIKDYMIKVSGSKEGIAKVLEVVKYYEEERIKQYRAGEPYYVDYLEWVSVCKGKKFDGKKALRLEKIDDIEEYVEELEKGEITIDASGPYGRGFATLDEIDLYNDIAEKLDDTVEFEGASPK